MWGGLLRANAARDLLSTHLQMQGHQMLQWSPRPFSNMSACPQLHKHDTA